MNIELPSGVEIALNIKSRSRALKKRIKDVFAEADVSYDAYKSWRSGRIEPRNRTVKKVDAVLKRHEEKNPSAFGLGI